MLDIGGDTAISLIYEAAADAALWPSALDRIVQVTGAKGAALLIRPPSSTGHVRPHFDTRLDRFARSARGIYFAVGPGKDRRPGWSDLWGCALHKPVRDDRFGIPASDLDARRDYRYLRRRLGFGRRIGVRLSPDPAWCEGLALFLGTGQTVPSDDALRPLLPHLTQALRQARLLSSLGARHGTGLDSLRHLRIGAILVRQDGRIALRNREARRILSQADGIAAQPEHNFRCHSALLTARLHAAVVEACATAEGRGNVPSFETLIDRPSGAAPWIVDATPLRTRGIAGKGMENAALLTLIDPDRTAWVDLDGFARICGLGPAARDACALMLEKGGTGAKIGVLGVGTRADLLRLIARVMPPVG
ncbi:hypothetical protein R5H30_19425 [Sulfitobacter sp. D35]|uniref:hypothetical protein n=1 Tax=Sulfitobacter sp. D35 TaxID=3083252 RepID=UPI00296E6B0C|nr:hypothetical protein [Sulfitobacter sp. D35]MDW4500167.1 hypothetical protein [Sulfitobacter sp. D35]